MEMCILRNNHFCSLPTATVTLMLWLQLLLLSVFHFSRVLDNSATTYLHLLRRLTDLRNSVPAHLLIRNASFPMYIVSSTVQLAHCLRSNIAYDIISNAA